MTNEGYLQTKIRDLNEEIETLEIRFTNLKNETKKLEDLKKEIDIKIDLIKDIEKNIMSKDIVKLQDEMSKVIIDDLKESLRGGLTNSHNKIADKITNQINNEICPSIYETINGITKKQMSALVMALDLMRRNFNEFIKINGGTEIPYIPISPISDSKKDIQKWLKRHNKYNKFRAQYSNKDDDPNIKEES